VMVVGGRDFDNKDVFSVPFDASSDTQDVYKRN